LLLAVDAGNTNLTVGAFAGDRLVRQWRLETDPRRPAGWYARALVKPFRTLGTMPDAAVYGSVVPALDRKIEAAVRRSFGLRAVAVTPRSKLGLALKVRTPNQVGADRVLNAVALKTLYGAPAVAVDFGTATTFDCLDASGAYAGGAILPGPHLAARALSLFTAKLPLVPVKRPARVIGRDTVECLQAGLYYGYLGMIREVLARTKKELGGRPKVVATGGLAGLFIKELPGVVRAPDLTLTGLRLAHQILHHG
jgi:type III pantothenate kinase